MDSFVFTSIHLPSLRQNKYICILKSTAWVSCACPRLTSVKSFTEPFGGFDGENAKAIFPHPTWNCLRSCVLESMRVSQSLADWLCVNFISG